MDTTPPIHAAIINDQIHLSGIRIILSRKLHNDEVLTLLVSTAKPHSDEWVLDAARGLGPVVSAPEHLHQT
jgi:hypothetical protein